MGFLKDLFIPQPIQTAPEMPVISTVMNHAKISELRSGIFTDIPVRKLVLGSMEKCLFCDYAVLITEKLYTVGRHNNGYGMSIRICRGLTWHTGTGINQYVRDKVQDYTSGKLYITDKRIVFSADVNAFSKTLKSLISYRTEGNDLIVQFSSSSHRIYLPVADCAEKVLEYLL